MEPPAKRLRILQSVEVDEEDPEYINAKRKQKERTKSRLESIFAKYENMHESMSDDIDMRTNTVVIDRGHLRRLNRQVDRKETILLDTLGMAAGDEGDNISGSEEGSQDSEDELAPTQPPKSRKRRLEETVEREQPMLPPPVTPANATSQAVVNLAPPNPAASLLNLVSFPQTPAGQQAQTTFYTTLAQTINQAVQQAVAPLFSSFLSTTPLPPANTLPTGDPIKPATDPKWFFPPLSVEKSKARTVQPSPIPSLKSQNSADNAITEHTKDNLESERECQTEEEFTQMPTVASTPPGVEAENQLSIGPRQNSPFVEIRTKRKGPPRKYNFTGEDDLYITKRKILHKRTWQEIKNSKVKWKNWPLHTFHHHWNQHLRDKQLHLTAGSTTFQVVSKSPEPNIKLDVVPHSPTQSHHLPTPSSLEQENSDKEAEYDLEEHVAVAFPSSSHFDDEELELLSLAGADSDSEHCPANKGNEPFSHISEDIILPSVEAEEFVDEDMLQQGLLETSSPVVHTFPAVTTIKTEPVESVSITSKHVAKYRVINFQAEIDSTDDDNLSLNLVADTTPSFLCTICQKPFKTAKTLERHQKNPGQRHDKFSRKKSASIDLVGDDNDDEMQAPTTPHIKREHSTPPATAFLIRALAFHTPKPSAPSVGLHSSGSKSTSKLDRRAYLKQVKQSWTKKATPGTKALAKRRSFQALPVKRGWDDDVDGEDELA